MLTAKAVITLGKDMTFRDYAQGAFRMRVCQRGVRKDKWRDKWDKDLELFTMTW
jgi:hypothetical protein